MSVCVWLHICMRVVCLWIGMRLLCIILHSLLISAYTFPHLLLKVNTCVFACFAPSPCNSLHILIISRWSNYSAACITLFMWHTISRQLTWASKCQPIGCAITPLSDISIIAAVPCFTLRQQGADTQSVSLSLYYILVWEAASVEDSASVSSVFLLLSVVFLSHINPPSDFLDFVIGLRLICVFLYLEMKPVFNLNNVTVLQRVNRNFCDRHDFMKRPLVRIRSGQHRDELSIKSY